MITGAIINDLLQLLQQIEDKDYSKQSNILSGASIGQHVRHSIEMYQCILNGYSTAEIDYSNRKRDIVIETSSEYAIKCLENIVQQINIADKPIMVKSEDNDTTVSSSFNREVLYCNEHLIHHLALIKVGLLELGKYQVAPNFGVAPSTIKYKQQCAQ